MPGFNLFGRRSAGQTAPEHTECSVRFNDQAVDCRIRVMVLMIGLDSDRLFATIAAQVEAFRARGREPILVTDRPCFEAVRGLDVVIETLPSAEMLKDDIRERHAAYIANKLASIRESWLITEELSLGRPVDALLAPCEEDGTCSRMAAGGTAKPSNLS